MSAPPPHHFSTQQSQYPHPPRVIPDPDRESRIRKQSEALQIRLAPGFAWGHKSTIAEGDSEQKPHHTPKMRNKPNLPHRRSTHDPNIRNEPNLTVRARHAVPQYAKRTQFTAPYTFYNLQSTIPWPNLSPAPSPTRWPKVSPDAHRGTQFPRQLSSRASGCGAKRSSPKPRDLPKHHRRRRSQSTNYQQPTTNQECEANPIPPRRTCGGQKIETNPICPPNPYCLVPQYAKRTQFLPTNIQSTIYNIQSPTPISTKAD